MCIWFNLIVSALELFSISVWCRFYGYENILKEWKKSLTFYNLAINTIFNEMNLDSF